MTKIYIHAHLSFWPNFNRGASLKVWSKIIHNVLGFICMKIGLLQSPVKKGSVRINLQSVNRQINAGFLKSWRKNPRKFLTSERLPLLHYRKSYPTKLFWLRNYLVALGWISKILISDWSAWISPTWLSYTRICNALWRLWSTSWIFNSANGKWLNVTIQGVSWQIIIFSNPC